MAKNLLKQTRVKKYAEWQIFSKYTFILWISFPFKHSQGLNAFLI